MENPLKQSIVNENRVHEARENMDQEINRKYDYIAPIIYESNSTDTKRNGVSFPLSGKYSPYT